MLLSSQLKSELEFSTSRSGGPGGQNVNKVETKVTLRWDLINSIAVTPDQKQVLLHRLAGKLTAEGILVITAQESRSQSENKERAIAKFEALVAAALRPVKARKATKASAASKRKRLQSKKSHGEKKRWRQRPGES